MGYSYGFSIHPLTLFRVGERLEKMIFVFVYAMHVFTFLSLDALFSIRITVAFLRLAQFKYELKNSFDVLTSEALDD